jgi:uncharacterized protein YecE (DUF72 family)
MPAPGKNSRTVRVGIGGWIYAPWKETFYPKGTRAADFLPYASRHLTSIEVNATFYRTQTAETFRGWREATPDGFVFALKGPRAATQVREAARAAVGVERFLGSGVTELGDKLGPIAWQFPATRKFVRDELAAFLDLLPAERDGVRLRHAVEASHESFRAPACAALLAERGVPRVLLGLDAGDMEPVEAGDFVYARLKGTVETEAEGFPATALGAWTDRIAAWSARRDCFVYVIAGAKARNPAAAQALIARLGR